MATEGHVRKRPPRPNWILDFVDQHGIRRMVQTKLPAVEENRQLAERELHRVIA